MTYGLKIENPSGKLVLSSDALGYRYVGTASLTQSASKSGVYGRLTPYIYTIALPPGAIYPIVGIKLTPNALVNGYPNIVVQQPVGIDFIFGYAGARRAVDSSTGAIYTDAYSITGPRFAGQNYGLLSVRNGCIYEGERIVYGLNYEYSSTYGYYGYKAYYAPTNGSKPASYNPSSATLSVEIESISTVTNYRNYSTLTFSQPTVYVFCPYVNSDGTSGYGLNLYDSSGTNLTFSSNKQPMFVSQTVDFAYATTFKSDGYGSFNNGSDLYLNGQAMSWSSIDNPVMLIGQGLGSVICERQSGGSAGEIIFEESFGWTYSGSTLKRVPYRVSQSSFTYDTSSDSIDVNVSPVRTVIINGTNFDPSSAPTGLLSVLYPSSISTNGTGTYLVAISPEGTSVYVSNGASNTIAVYSRNTTTGALSYINIVASGLGIPCGIVVSPDGKNVYVACGAGSGGISVFTRNLSTGALTQPGYTSYSAYDSYFLCISPDGKHVYSAGFANGSGQPIYIYDRNISTGDLSRQSVSIYSPGSGNFCWTISPDGVYVYLSLYLSNSVAVYSRNSSTGVLTYLQIIGTGTNPSYSALSPDGLNLYVSNYGSTSISVFSRNTSNGTLSSLTTVTTSAAPGGVVLSPEGNFLYCAIYGSNVINQYSRNSGGALTPLSSPTIATGANPYGMASSSDGKNVYVANYSSGTIGQYTIS